MSRHSRFRARAVAGRLLVCCCVSLGALAVASGAALAGDPPAAAVGQTLAGVGTSTGVPACGDCHGVGGLGKADAPRLAGLDAAYLRDQLAAYAKGMREDEAMSKIAKAMDAKAIGDAAAYFASLPTPPASSPSLPARSQAAAGAALALRGDWTHDIPPCAACHARDGGGVGSAFPALAGQPAAYVAARLKAWKAGTRHADPHDLMRVVAARLDDAQIAAVAAYYATPAGVTPPPEPALSSGGLGEMVALGQSIFRDPSEHAGAFVGNALTCENCHLDAGRRANSGAMGAAFLKYPAYRKKEGRVITFAERLQGCFRYSMNGKPPALGDSVLVALESYAYVLATGLPTGVDMPGRGYPRLAPAEKGLDFARGAALFADKCAICHGAEGRGQTAAGTTVFPPLWGPQSFNWGAGMSSIGNAAGFIKANMPFGQGYSLSDQEAWDVATFVDGHARPQDPRFTGDVATTRRLYHDDPLSLYGLRVDGVTLGEAAPAAVGQAVGSETR